MPSSNFHGVSLKGIRYPLTAAVINETIIDKNNQPAGPAAAGDANQSSFVASCIRSFRVRIRRILRSASSTTGAGWWGLEKKGWDVLRFFFGGFLDDKELEDHGNYANL